jgi:hypothetical protein
MNYDDEDGSPRKQVVGYRKPPKNTRFKPGKSGNPKGRPKGSENLPTMIARILNAKIGIREGNKVRRVSQVEAIMRSLSVQAMKGDAKASMIIIALAKEYGHMDPSQIYKFTLNVGPQPSPFAKRSVPEEDKLPVVSDPRDREDDGSS